MSLYSELFRCVTTSSGSQWKFKSRENIQFYLKYWRIGVDQRPPVAFLVNHRVEQHSVADRPVVTLRHRQHASDKHVVFLHGGAFINPMGFIHWQFIQRLMKNTGCSASVPLYGLVPRYNHRDAYELLQQHYRELLEEKSPEDIVFMGDSSGGGLALGFAQRISTQPLPGPGGVVMISPWLDITLSNPDITEVQPRDALLAVPGSCEAGRLWAAGEDPRNPCLSPVYGPVAGLPPLSLIIGTNDILLPDARRLHERVKAVGGSITYREFEGMFHLWALLPTLEGFEAMSQVSDFVRSPVRLH